MADPQTFSADDLGLTATAPRKRSSQAFSAEDLGIAAPASSTSDPTIPAYGKMVSGAYQKPDQPGFTFLPSGVAVRHADNAVWLPSAGRWVNKSADGFYTNAPDQPGGGRSARSLLMGSWRSGVIPQEWKDLESLKGPEAGGAGETIGKAAERVTGPALSSALTAAAGGMRHWAAQRPGMFPGQGEAMEEVFGGQPADASHATIADARIAGAKKLEAAADDAAAGAKDAGAIGQWKDVHGVGDAANYLTTKASELAPVVGAGPAAPVMMGWQAKSAWARKLESVPWLTPAQRDDLSTKLSIPDAAMGMLPGSVAMKGVGGHIVAKTLGTAGAMFGKHLLDTKIGDILDNADDPNETVAHFLGRAWDNGGAESATLGALMTAVPGAVKAFAESRASSKATAGIKPGPLAEPPIESAPAGRTPTEYAKTKVVVGVRKDGTPITKTRVNAMPGEQDLGNPAGYTPPTPEPAPPMKGLSGTEPVFDGSGNVVGRDFRPGSVDIAPGDLDVSRGTLNPAAPSAPEATPVGATLRGPAARLAGVEEPPSPDTLNPVPQAVPQATPEPSAPTGSSPRPELVAGSDVKPVNKNGFDYEAELAESNKRPLISKDELVSTLRELYPQAVKGGMDGNSIMVGLEAHLIDKHYPETRAMAHDLLRAVEEYKLSDYDIEQLVSKAPSSPSGSGQKAAPNIIDSTSYQGTRRGALLGPNDEQLVARDPSTGKDLGRLWVTKMGDGFEVRKVEVDPSAQRQGVATSLYQEAANRFGRYQGSTDQTPQGKALVDSLRNSHPHLFEANPSDLQYLHAGLDPREALNGLRSKDKEWDNLKNPGIAASLKKAQEAFGGDATTRNLQQEAIEKMSSREVNKLKAVAPITDEMSGVGLIKAAKMVVQKQASLKEAYDAMAGYDWVPAEARMLVGKMAPEGVAVRKPGDWASPSGREYHVFADPAGVITKVLPKETWDTIAAVEQGKDVSGTPLGDSLMHMKAVYDGLQQRAQALGPEVAKKYRENYMGHEWEFYSSTENKGGGARVFRDVNHGIREAGFEPKDANYYKTFANKVSSAEQFLGYQELAKAAAERGEIVPLPKSADGKSQAVPPGMVQIENPMFTVNGEQMMATPEVAGVFNRLTSKRFADVADTAANRLTKGIKEGTRWVPGTRGQGIDLSSNPVQTIQDINNTIVGVRFGLSAAHGMAVNQLLVADTIAGAMHHAEMGSNPLKAFGDTGFAIKNAGAIKDNLMGLKSDPNLAPYVDMFSQWGLRLKRDEIYNPRFAEDFRDAMTKSEWGRAGRLAPFAVLDKIASPVLEHLVPRLKLISAIQQMRRVMELHPDIASDPAKLRQYGQEVSRSIDNRYGQLIYDNMLTHKIFRDAMQMTLQAPGWQIGDIREAGGAVRDIAKTGASLAKGDKPAIPKQLNQVVAMAVTYAAVGALYQYLRTGETPKSLVDCYFPRTGRMVAGKPERDKIIGYGNDVATAIHDLETKGPIQGIIQYFKPKMSPMITAAVETYNDKDFYGRKPSEDRLAWAMRMLNPMATNMLQRASDRGEAGFDLGKSFIGVTPAPGWVGSSDAMNFLEEKAKDRMPQSISAEEYDKRRRMAPIKGAAQNKDYAPLLDAVGKEMSGKQVMDTMKSSGSPRAEFLAKLAPFDDALKAYQMAEGDEKNAIGMALRKRVLSMSRNPGMKYNTEFQKNLDDFNRIVNGVSNGPK